MKKNISLEFGGFALIEYLLSKGSFPKNFKVLDIGGALGNHCKVMRYFGLCVDTIDKYEKKAEFIGDFNSFVFNSKYDMIFCSHVIEHQRNQGIFLDKIFDLLNDDGDLVISGPNHPAQRFVEGHIASTILPIFLQILIYSGFDCKNGKMMSLSNIENSFIVKKDPNFNLNERLESGYKWTHKHQNRSPIDLKTGFQIINDLLYLQNCETLELVFNSKNNKEVLGIKLNYPSKYVMKNLKLKINTFNNFFIFDDNFNDYKFIDSSYVELNL